VPAGNWGVRPRRRRTPPRCEAHRHLPAQPSPGPRRVIASRSRAARRACDSHPAKQRDTACHGSKSCVDCATRDGAQLARGEARGSTSPSHGDKHAAQAWAQEGAKGRERRPSCAEASRGWRPLGYCWFLPRAKARRSEGGECQILTEQPHCHSLDTVRMCAQCPPRTRRQVGGAVILSRSLSLRLLLLLSLVSFVIENTQRPRGGGLHTVASRHTIYYTGSVSLSPLSIYLYFYYWGGTPPSLSLSLSLS